MTEAETKIRLAFPDLSEANAHEHAYALFSDLKQNPDVRAALNLNQSAITRTDRKSMDFGATLVLVFGTPAVIILAKAIRSWVERTGTTSIVLNGVRIENVNSRDAASIVQAINQTRSISE